ncbi:hypothetical protein P154DRAFT_436713 [Amniculicola lignicola CBS 123094]|uniref:C2H2-type domain-containing protein n=1 Tax=Amniculicola lignicola CBS 123094 TaxID=1392246 RepID=A0A6A5WFG1_9PLEO|nr:hypothetical protein P154DRAFT_436713 [Amniculicola lignicola CBS 123094]
MGSDLECRGCYKQFGSFHARSQHMDAVGHWQCDTCFVQCWDEDALNEHMNDEYHWKDDRIECEGCYSWFDTKAEAKRHMYAENHFRTYFCTSCDKGFETDNNLKQHMNSSIHRGANIACPFCKRGFATATGVTHHLETGSCPNAPSLNRETIYNEIRKRDPNHVITKKLLTYPGPGSSTVEVTNRCWNGFNYECYLCDKEFATLQAVNQHVNSPAHKQKVYHCPGRGCAKEFMSLASLFNHLESESCGAVKFESVQRNVGSFLTGRRTIGFA